MKRLLDLLLALGLLVPALVICIPTAIAIRLESRGNPLFLQTRVGRFERPFTLWKLRSMAFDTEHVGSHEVSNAKITKVGRFIRRVKIDELPQIVNVLLGQMSFVGPRPCLPVQQELISARRAKGVFQIRPGITGPAQIAGVDMSTPELLADYDARYMSERTLQGDLILILKTARGGGSGDAAKTQG